MKKLFLAVAVWSAVSAANATFLTADIVKTKDGSNVQKSIDRLDARNAQQDKDIHDTYVLANTKYTESAGKALEGEVRNNKKDQQVRDAGQDAKIDGNQAAQVIRDKGQDDAIKQVDNRALNAQLVAAGASGMAAQVQSNLDVAINQQQQRDAGQDQHINAVQEAAETANGRAGALETRADEGEEAIRNVQASAEAANGRAGALETRADAGEASDSRQDGLISANTSAIATKVDKETFAADQQRQDKVITTNTAAIATKVDSSVFKADQQRQDQALATGLATKVDNGVFQQRAQDLQSRIETNRADQQKVNKAMAGTLDNHGQRLNALEETSRNKFADIDKRFDKVEKKANAGTSTALAAASIPQVLESQSFSLGAGVGGYESEQAVAVGFSARVSQSVVVKAAVGTDTQHGVGYNAGVSVGW